MARIDFGQRWVALAFAVALGSAGCTTGDDGARGGWSDAGTIGYYPSDGASSYDAGPWGGPGSDAGVAPGDPGDESGRPGDRSADAGLDAGTTEPDAGADECALRETMDPLVLYMSADDSNSMAAPAIARRQIRDGQNPSRSYLRTYEFLNYYNVAYPAPAQDHINVVPELRETDEPGELLLQVGLQSAPRVEQPKARVITLVLDTSGSMGGEPIRLLREACRAIAATLRPGDIVSIVEWDTTRVVPLEAHVVSGPDDTALVAAIDALDSGGGTDLESGLRHGYELALDHYDETKLNRVVLISDGQANVGVTSKELIALHAQDAERAGIYLVGVGVGDGVNDMLMDVVTDLGRGAYVYLDGADEARHMFTERFDEVMDVGLLDVRLELTLPWYMAIREFHGEEVSTIPKEVTPQHLAPGDAMVFNQVLGACEPDLLDTADRITARATYVRPNGRVEASDQTEATMADLLTRPDVGLARGQAIVAYAEALKTAYGATPEEARAALEEARMLAEDANPEGTDRGLNEIVELIDLYLGRL